MAMEKQIQRLQAKLAAAREDIKDLHEQVEWYRKRYTAIKQAWRRVHPEDQAFMQSFKTDDPDLFDVYNDLLYSFGRPDERGVVFTRLDSWNK